MTDGRALGVDVGPFRSAAVEWAAGGDGASLVDAAAQALVDGLDSPNLRMLAGARSADAEDEADEYGPLAFAELELDIPPRSSRDAVLACAVQIARRVVSGAEPARPGAQAIYRLFVRSRYEADELATFSGIDDFYDMLDNGTFAGSYADADRTTMGECIQLIGSLGERYPDLGTPSPPGR